MKLPSQEVNFILTGGVHENKSKGIANRGKDDAAAACRSGSRFFENNYFHRERAVQSVFNACIPNGGSIWGDGGRFMLFKGK